MFKLLLLTLTICATSVLMWVYFIFGFNGTTFTLAVVNYLLFMIFLLQGYVINKRDHNDNLKYKELMVHIANRKSRKGGH